MPITSLPSPPFDLIRCDDPRLRSICPTLAAFGPSTVAQLALTGDPQAARTLNTAEAQLRSWAARTARTTLDDLAAELLDAWERSRPPDEVVRYGLPVKPGEPRAAPPLRPEVRQAVAARLGLRGAPPATLATAARGSGVSTERIRRVALQVQAAATTWAWAPALDEALRLGADPVDPDDYGDALQARGLTRRPWHPQAVNALARLCGRVQRVAWHPDPDRSLLLDLAEQAIRHRHLGIAPVVDIAATAAEQLGRPVKPEMVVAALASGDRGLAVAGTWVWRPGRNGTQSPVTHVARGMLAIAGSLPITAIHQGWCRRLRGRGITDAPPLDALAALLRSHHGFVVDSQADDTQANATVMVRLAQPLRPEQVYPRAAMVLIDAIRTAPGHLATHADLDRAATDAAISIHTVSTYLSYHEAFTRYAPTLWTLVGVEVDPQAANEALAADRAPDGTRRS